MLKPEDVKYKRADEPALNEIAKSFDTAIQLAAVGGNWPAIVGDARDDASPEQIDTVIQRYRAAGWLVERGPSHLNRRATITHPDGLDDYRRKENR